MLRCLRLVVVCSGAALVLVLVAVATDIGRGGAATNDTVADRVNEFGSASGKGHVKSAGTLADERGEVRDVCDGGEDAFDARMKFYKQTPP